MPDNAKITDKAKGLAAQAAAAAGPIAEQARVRTAQGVDVVATGLDKVTGGRFSEQIHSVAEKVEGVIDTKPKPVQDAPTPTKDS